jgi:hypothetical protein
MYIIATSIASYIIPAKGPLALHGGWVVGRAGQRRGPFDRRAA